MDTDEPTTPKAKKPKKDRISELGVERGVDQAVVFTTPYRPAGARGGVMQELLNYTDEENGPTIKQLATMRRLDGHAQALFGLLTLPIRAALNASTFNATEGGEKEAEFIEAVFTTAPAAGEVPCDRLRQGRRFPWRPGNPDDCRIPPRVRPARRRA